MNIDTPLGVNHSLDCFSSRPAVLASVESLKGANSTTHNVRPLYTNLLLPLDGSLYKSCSKVLTRYQTNPTRGDLIQQTYLTSPAVAECSLRRMCPLLGTHCPVSDRFLRLDRASGEHYTEFTNNAGFNTQFTLKYKVTLQFGIMLSLMRIFSEQTV